MFIGTQCSKEDDKINTVQPKISIDTKSLERSVASELLVAARNTNFRKLILTECLKQEFGDYYVRLNKLVNMHSDDTEINTELAKLKPLILSLQKAYNGTEPVLFYPKSETYEKQNKQHVYNKKGSYKPSSTTALGQPIAVMQDEYNPVLQECPGYMANINGELIYFREINEEFAWQNDVWVLGQEEDVSPENMIAAEDIVTTLNRSEGQAEYTGYIQVIDLGAIEPWASGKLEFNTTVFNSTGTKVWGTKRYGKWKRENFKNNKWANFGNSFIGNWNTSTYGRWMYEQWMEEDGGASSETTVTFTTPANPQIGAPGTTISNKIPSQQRDDDLGGSLVQFSDDIEQVYTISFMNFKRRN